MQCEVRKTLKLTQVMDRPFTVRARFVHNSNCVLLGCHNYGWWHFRYGTRKLHGLLYC